MGKLKIILVEFSESHSEILISQLLSLKNSEYEIHIWINEKLKFDDKSFPFVIINKHKADNHYTRIKFTLGLIFYILRKNISKVIINTAEGLLLRNFAILSLLFKYDVIGILHLSNKLFDSTTQKLISLKIKKYFVLSEYILKNCRANFKNLDFEVYYPINILQHYIKAKTNNTHFVISIPGEISPYRRSYFDLIDIIDKNRNLIYDNIKFEILGIVKIKEGERVIEEIKKRQLENYFILYDKQISDEEFYQRCCNCDLIMPLIHPEIDNYNNYKNYQISGTFNLSYIFQKPMLMHKSFSDISEFKDITIFYDNNNLINILNSIIENKNVLDKFSAKFNQLKTDKFLNQDFRYIKFIEK